MEVAWFPEAEDELVTLPARERIAIGNAIDKLRAAGDQLPAPHSSHVIGSDVRELRPRSGRSPWRAFYRRVGDQMVILSIGPEAQRDPRGFDRAVRNAEDRLAQLEEDQER